MNSLRIGIVGSGNVAWHFSQIFSQLKQVTCTVFARTLSGDPYLFETKVALLSTLDPDALDVIFLAVSDASLEEVAKKLENTTALVVHTSGFTGLAVLASKRRGVFYLFQSMTKGVVQDLTGAPILLEASAPEDLEILKKLAAQYFENIHILDSQQRKYLHVAAVFANNFTNHMLFQAEQICKAHDLPFESLLRPLIEETIRKQRDWGAIKAQTGPAVRKDFQTIEGHKALLNETQKEVYKAITESILKSRN